MAEIEVQPKKKGSILPWILLALGALALIIFLMRNTGDDRDNAAVTNREDTLSATSGNAAMDGNNGNGMTSDSWAGIDRNAPRANYDEVTNRDIEVRGNQEYGIYGIGENILFDVDKSTIRTGAGKDLEQVAASIGKRYGNGNIRVYGYTDAQGSPGYNKELAEERARAVRDWLVQKGNITEDRISIHPVGEANPVATNETERGRQQNRRVEIVARNTDAGNSSLNQ
jgi:outer membrane protein OmpA-like peptidoglycan-associated protein